MKLINRHPLLFCVLLVAAWLGTMLLLAKTYGATPLPEKPVTMRVIPANAPPSVVTPELICKVKNSIRYRTPAWPDWYCGRVSTALNTEATATGKDPVVLASIGVVESDFRPNAHHWYGSSPVPGACGDLGLMGVRCCLGPDMLCSNSLVKGWKYPAVLKLENNIMLGAKILAATPTLNDYNGGKGYSEKVYAVAGAFVGIRTKSPVKRIRKLIHQILEGLGFERTT